MGKYGKSAIIATKLLKAGKESNPVTAWECAVAEVFPESESSRKKGCPKSTFLGLCEEGLVAGVGSGEYTNSKKNKGYAKKSLRLLIAKPDLATNTKKLWELVLEGEKKQHNQQMDVVISLWKNGSIDQGEL